MGITSGGSLQKGMTQAQSSAVFPLSQTKDSFKNAYSTKIVNQFKKLRNSCSVGRAYIWKNSVFSGDAAYKFSIGVNMGGYKTAEWDFVADADGFYRMRYGYVGSIRTPTAFVDASNLSRTPLRSGDNAYFRSSDGLNSTFDIVFTGTGFLSNHYVSTDGGLFAVSVDGVAIGNISSHSSNPENAAAVSSNISKLIISGLPNTTHTATFTFIGSDPLYPPASGTSRGWFKYSDGTPPEAYTANIIAGSEMGIGSTKTLVSNGILEFAINATPSGSGFATDWVPAHSSATGCVVITSRKIFIDDVLLTDSLARISAEQEIKEFTMVQEYTAYNSADASKSQPMWTGKLITKFDRLNGLTYSHNITTLTDITVQDGYMSMCSGQRRDSSGNTVFKKIICDNGFALNIDSVSPVSQINHYSGVLKSAAWLGDKIGLAITVDSPESSSGLGRPYTDSNATLTTERTDRFCKLYFKPLGSNKTVPAGQCFESNQSIWLAVF